MEIQPFLFSFSRFFLFFYFSFTPLLSCYFVFEHDSGDDPLSDWNRCCAWIVVALFWCDCNSMCEYIQRLWWKWIFFPSGFSSLWLEVKSNRWCPAHPVGLWRTQPHNVDCAMCGCGYAGLNKQLQAKLQCTVWFGGDGQLSLWSWTYLGYRCSLYIKLNSSVPS